MSAVLGLGEQGAVHHTLSDCDRGSHVEKPDALCWVSRPVDRTPHALGVESEATCGISSRVRIATGPDPPGFILRSDRNQTRPVGSRHAFGSQPNPIPVTSLRVKIQPRLYLGRSRTSTSRTSIRPVNPRAHRDCSSFMVGWAPHVPCACEAPQWSCGCARRSPRKTASASRGASGAVCRHR